jgi:glycosyltransferase involved in cell wall biosynthesis
LDRKSLTEGVTTGKRFLVSLVIPTKNEAKTISEVIQRANAVFDEMGLDGEVLVADSSTDGTAKIAASCGARVVAPKKLGYGNAYLAGFEQARGEYIVLMDGDLTYDPRAMKEILPLLMSGSFDMVMGSRLKGKILPGSMPPLHRYIGNPFLTWVLNSLFSAGISDAHCGLRAITRTALQKLNIRTGGMEFASEMVIEASRRGLRIAEVPITYPRGAVKAQPLLRRLGHLVHDALPTSSFSLPVSFHARTALMECACKAQDALWFWAALLLIGYRCFWQAHFGA